MVGVMQYVPIYTVAESQDYMVRGYTRCPAYQRRYIMV